MPKTFLEYMNYVGGFGLSYAHSTLKPIASLGDTPPKGSAGRTTPGAGLHANTDKILYMKLLRKAMSTMPGSQKQKELSLIHI